MINFAKELPLNTTVVHSEHAERDLKVWYRQLVHIFKNRQQSALLHASVMTVFQIIINCQISSRPIILYEVLQKIGGCQIKFDEFCTKVFLSSWRLTWLAWDAIFSRTMRWKQNIRFMQNIHTIHMKWIYDINWGVYEIYIKYKSYLFMLSMQWM